MKVFIMLSKQSKKYCCEDISLIENYEEAVISEEMYDCHHRKEDEGYKQKYLIDNDLYYNRPASELIFISQSLHRKMHSEGNIIRKGIHLSEEIKRKMSEAHKGIHFTMSEETKEKMSIAQRKRFENEEERKRISNKLKGRVFSEDRKRKISEARKKK